MEYFRKMKQDLFDNAQRSVRFYLLKYLKVKRDKILRDQKSLQQENIKKSFKK